MEFACYNITHTVMLAYLGGPTFGRDIRENIPIPRFEQPLKLTAHGEITVMYIACLLAYMSVWMFFILATRGVRAWKLLVCSSLPYNLEEFKQ